MDNAECDHLADGQVDTSDSATWRSRSLVKIISREQRADLQDLAGDVEGEVRGVDDTLDKRQVARHEVLVKLVTDEHPLHKEANVATLLQPVLRGSVHMHDVICRMRHICFGLKMRNDNVGYKEKSWLAEQSTLKYWSNLSTAHSPSRGPL